MKSKFLYLLLFMITINCHAQVEIKPMYMQDYMDFAGYIIHTAKIKVINNNDRCVLLYLKNDKDITGYDSKGSAWVNTINFIEEYGGTLLIDNLDEWNPVPFFNWFIKLEPMNTFTFYFQYRGPSLELEKITNLIKYTNKYCDRTSVMEDLGWKNDEIVITINPKMQ